MPWCPYCKTEYQSGVTHCSDCSAPLVEELPSHTDPASPRPVFLTEIRRDVDAALSSSFWRTMEFLFYSMDVWKLTILLYSIQAPHYAVENYTSVKTN